MTSTGMPTGRPLRRDAEQNRQRILAAADRLMAEHGLGVGHDLIAREAQVAVGTVYRRFPDKASLVAALFTDQVDRVVAVARDAATEDDPWRAVVKFLTGILELQAASRGLRELSAGSPHGVELARYSRRRIAPVVKEIVARGHVAGVIRPDVTEQDFALIPLMIGAVIRTSRHTDPQLWRRTLAIVLAGIRPGDPDPLPGSAPTAQQLARMIGG
ncbi:MAG: TetR/AcrR family transcriptional regulator [Lapillicoccus sp.]